MTERRVIRVPVTLDSANRRRDRSVRLAATTNLEIDNADFAEMDTFVGTTGWLVYAENQLDVSDVPPEDAIAVERKTKGQRQRAVWFLIWKKARSRGAVRELVRPAVRAVDGPLEGGAGVMTAGFPSRTYDPKVCACCGRRFTPASRLGRYCTRECYRMASNKRKQERKLGSASWQEL